MEPDTSSAFTDRLISASREELLEHVLLQRDLIQRLHQRVLDLEACVDSRESEVCAHAPSPTREHAPRVREGSYAQLTAHSPPQKPPGSPQISTSTHEDTPTHGSIDARLRDVNQVLAAHAAGRPRLPPTMVRQLLLIREDLRGQLPTGLILSQQERIPQPLVQPRWIAQGAPGQCARSPSQHEGTPTQCSSAVGQGSGVYADQSGHERCFDDYSAPTYLAQKLVSAWAPLSSSPREQ